MISKQEQENLETLNEAAETELRLPSPREIYDYLNKHVIGQDDAKRVLSVAVYNHYKRLFFRGGYAKNRVAAINPDLESIDVEKSNIMLAGSTGSGKTYMIKQIAKFLDVPCYIADMTKVTESGYVGDDVESVLSGLLRECNYNVPLAEIGIVILDEADKICKRNAGQSLTRDVGGEGVQQSLLKIVEGSVVNVPPAGGRKHPEQPGIPVDTSNILFIAMGAFPGLDKIVERRCKPHSTIGFSTGNRSSKTYAKDYNFLHDLTAEDIKNFGFISEFVGRFPVITYTSELTEKDLVRILTEPQNAITKQYQKMFAADNVNLVFEPAALKEIARMANENKTGARALRGILEKVLFETMFEVCGKYEEPTDYVVTKKIVKNAFK